MRSLSLLTGVALALVVAAPAARAGGLIYDCSTVYGTAEQYICQQDDLAFLNLNMQEIYAAAVASIDETVFGNKSLKDLKDTQVAWKKRRDACMQANDKKKCIVDITHRRIAYLQARFLLIKGGEPKFYLCDKNPSDELIATLFEGAMPAVRLERGEKVAVAVLTSSSSGQKYVNDAGVEFWSNGDKAEVQWPAGTKLSCHERK